MTQLPRLADRIAADLIKRDAGQWYIDRNLRNIADYNSGNMLPSRDLDRLCSMIERRLKKDRQQRELAHKIARTSDIYK